MNIDELYTLKHHEKGAEMQVRNAEGKELKMYLTLAGVDSKLYRKEKTALSRKIMANRDTDLEDARAESLAEVTLGWRGFESKGKKLKFSKEQVKKLYINAPYIMDQIDGFIFNRVNFTQG